MNIVNYAINEVKKESGLSPLSYIELQDFIVINVGDNIKDDSFSPTVSYKFSKLDKSVSILDFDELLDFDSGYLEEKLIRI